MPKRKKRKENQRAKTEGEEAKKQVWGRQGMMGSI